MPEAVVKGLLIAGGVSLTCFVIGLLVYAGNQGSLLASGVITETADTAAALTDSKLQQYDSNVVYGAEVLNAIRRYQGDIAVTVTTLDKDSNEIDLVYSGTVAWDNAPYLADGTVNPNYINPYAQFSSELTTNANGVTAGLSFKQKSYVALAETGPLVGNNTSLGGSGGSSGGTEGNTGGIDFATLQDVVNSQSATIAELVEAHNNSESGNAAFNAAIQDQLTQLSTEQAELRDALSNVTDAIEDLEELSVKMDALEGTVSSLGGSSVFDKDGTFTFKANKTYYLSAIACGGAGSSGGAGSYRTVTLGCNPDTGQCYTSGNYTSAVTGAGGNRGQYIIRREIKFTKDTQAAFIIGTNSNNGNTVITFENGEVITLKKGNGGGGAASTSMTSNGGYGTARATAGRGGAGGFYKTTMKGFSLVNGSGSTGGNGTANVTPIWASNGGGASRSYSSSSASASGGTGGAGYGAGGGSGAVAAIEMYVSVYPGPTYYHGFMADSGNYGPVSGSSGKGAPGVVIIETE